MRIGLIGRGDYTGLAIQTRAYAKHLAPSKVLLVDLSRHSAVPPKATGYEQVPLVMRWNDRKYPDVTVTQDYFIDEFLKDLDVVITAETPYNYYLFSRAKELGVASVLIPNFEFLDYMAHDDLPKPDLFLLPSQWRQGWIEDRLGGCRIRYLPVPVDTDVFQWTDGRDRQQICHIVGTGTGEDRNGTASSILAMEHLDDMQLNVKSQRPWRSSVGSNVSMSQRRVENHADLYGNEAFFLMPRKFGGLCLPMQESMALGMVPIMTNCDPNDRILPKSCLIPAIHEGTLMTRSLIDVWGVNPENVAETVRNLAKSDDIYIEAKEAVRKHVESISWKSLLGEYIDVLSNI